MNLISTLNEASSIPIESLKKVIQKDKRVNAVFKAGLDIESIPNRVEFIQTLKHLLLNNKSVLDFVNGRDYVKDLDKRALTRLRQIKPVDLNQKDVDLLQTFVNDLFREHSYVERSGLSASTRKEIVSWMNGNGRYFNLTSGAQKELASVPSLKPDGPIVLYRGLLFSKDDLREKKRYDGQLQVGDGLRFLRSVKAGARVLDLDWDRPASWTTSKEVAMRFAQFKSAQSNFEATTNWLTNAAAGKKIHGELGFIVSTLAQPDDVLIDVAKLATSAHIKHGDEGEFILKPGSYKCRITTKYTKVDGEVDPTAPDEVDEAVSSAIEATRDFARTWGKNPEFQNLVSDDWTSVDAERALRRGDLEQFGVLARASTKEAILKSYKELQEFYKEHIANLTDAQLESLVANDRVGKIVPWISDVRERMNRKTRHTGLRSNENPRGEAKTHELTPEQKRETTGAMMSRNFETASKGVRYTDWSVGNAVNTIINGFGGTEVKDLHRKGKVEQQAALQKALDSFYSAMNLEQPAVYDEAVRRMKSALLGAERNAAMINEVLAVREALNEVTNSSAA